MHMQSVLADSATPRFLISVGLCLIGGGGGGLCLLWLSCLRSFRSSLLMREGSSGAPSAQLFIDEFLCIHICCSTSHCITASLTQAPCCRIKGYLMSLDV